MYCSYTGMDGMRSMRRYFLVCNVCIDRHWYELVCAGKYYCFIKMSISRVNTMGMQSIRYPPPPEESGPTVQSFTLVGMGFHSIN